MIAKRIDRKVANDNYRALALYIGGFTEQEPGEKVLSAWSVGCELEDFRDSFMEVEAVQALNTTTSKDKTYHLMLSFRPEDEARLSVEIMQDIERQFAEALGFSEHQRHCGIHKNTNNMHLHIAYNMIHPRTFARHEPYRDFNKLSQVCREIEQKYGLQVDNGMATDVEPKRTNTKAQTMEAHTGQQSFLAYCQGKQTIFDKLLSDTSTWPEFHQTLAKYGVGIKESGRGFALYDLHGKQHIKASAVSRILSRSNLEKQLGSFIPGVSAELKLTPAQDKYERKPLQRDPNREHLYEQYQQAYQGKKTAYTELDAVKELESAQIQGIKEKWQLRRQEIKANTKLLQADRWKLLQEVMDLQRQEIGEAREPRKELTEALRKEFPFRSWADFLRLKALDGDATALSILQSKKDIVDTPEHKPKEQIDHSRDKQAVLANDKLTTNDKKRLLAVMRLEEKIGVRLKTSISPSGVIIFALPTGGTIRDTGKQIYFSEFDPKAIIAAQAYAAIKWGKMQHATENTIVFKKPHQRDMLSR